MAMHHSEVQVVESSLVTPSQETPRHQLWLSALDLLQVSPGHTPTVYLYRRRAAGDGDDDFFDVARLKASLARALVPFYPVAGRLALDAASDGGRFVIDCNAEGRAIDYTLRLKSRRRVISWLGMPVYDADYGWGKPERMVRAEVERSGFVYLMDDGGGGGVQVVVCVDAAILDQFEHLLYAKLSA
ncbi:hypothetical protein HU200_045486 [Digitaria exilis]|uniref:Uncharacterized protein n=1 Tax=Digitaria exilis TaxID=1010633 RepID=A0A835EAL0_9POAL|nr:hypothetical protein HU200_045486 [Digitaria exilis]